MGWLLGYTMASMGASFVVVRIFEWILSGAGNTASDAARSTVGITAWAGVTALSGMRGVSKSAGRLRFKSSTAKNQLDTLIKERK